MMEIRAILPQERNYTYSQSQQISMQTGCIGYLRADMGNDGNDFFSTWNDFRKDLKTQEFKDEFDGVINSLREKDGIFSNRSALSTHCFSTPDSAFGNDREFGVRVNTEKYAYLMRLNPYQGEYNLYCYCYRRDWLDSHLKKAERGIRFITPQYSEKFRIPDGDKIQITSSWGEKNEYTCRYIDDYHLEVGRNLYHICELAERMEQNGATITPLRSSLPRKCFSALPSTGELIVIERGTKGYIPIKQHPEGKTAQEAADIANDVLGVTKSQEAAMLAGSMFGFDVPAADPKNYDESGAPIKPKQKDRGDAR